MGSWTSCLPAGLCDGFGSRAIQAAEQKDERERDGALGGESSVLQYLPFREIQVAAQLGVNLLIGMLQGPSIFTLFLLKGEK